MDVTSTLDYIVKGYLLPGFHQYYTCALHVP